MSENNVPKTVSWYTEDVTDECFNRMMTCSDDREVHIRHHLRHAFTGAIYMLFDNGVQFPFTVKCSAEEVRDNMNIKYKLTLEILDEQEKVSGVSGDRLQVLSNQQMDIALTGTGLSSKTKALRAYAREGYDHSAISVASDAVMRAEIPLENRAGFALYLVNSKMNGFEIASYRKLRGGRVAGNTAGFYDVLYGDSEGMRHVYSKVRQSTLAKWSSALVLIDEAFQGDG